MTEPLATPEPVPPTLAPALPPSYLKLGIYGHTGSGKTYTAVKVLSQFIAEYLPDKQLAMFDTEGGAGYIAAMVQQITGKPLLVVTGQAFSELLWFAKTCRDAGHVAIVDSITHPWRNLMEDCLRAKRSRVRSASGREATVRLSFESIALKTSPIPPAPICSTIW